MAVDWMNIGAVQPAPAGSTAPAAGLNQPMAAWPVWLPPWALASGAAGPLPVRAWGQVAPQGIVPGLGVPLGSVIGVAGQGGQVLPFAAGLAPGVVPLQATPDIDTLAMTDLLQSAAGSLIQKLYGYLQNYGKQQPQLNTTALPLLSAAVQRFSHGDYAGAFAQTYQAFRSVAALRAANPTLPAIGSMPATV